MPALYCQSLLQRVRTQIRSQQDTGSDLKPKLFDTLVLFLREFLKTLILKKQQQFTAKYFLKKKIQDADMIIN